MQSRSALAYMGCSAVLCYQSMLCDTFPIMSLSSPCGGGCLCMVCVSSIESPYCQVCLHVIHTEIYSKPAVC